MKGTGVRGMQLRHMMHYILRNRNEVRDSIKRGIEGSRRGVKRGSKGPACSSTPEPFLQNEGEVG